MAKEFYQTRQFAHKAAVSVRTLRYYDKVGLLTPTSHTNAGHRLYSDADLLSLQQILALKFLGFSLAEIKAYVQARPSRWTTVLARQKAMLHERRTHLDTVIQAIEEAERQAHRGQADLDAIVRIIEVIQMEQKNDWVKKYFTPEQAHVMNEMVTKAYSDAANLKIAQWGEWTAEDQRRVDEQYATLAADLKAAVANGVDPASPEAQDIARRQTDLIQGFTRGDADIEAGVQAFWQEYNTLPQQEKPFAALWGEEEQAFLDRAVSIYQERLQE